jgi:15-cis-phytoene synthase
MLQVPPPPTTFKKLSPTPEFAYELCRQITETYGKTFYLATLLMSPNKRRAIWAIYAWCRNTDELVDGAMANATTATLDRWETQLEGVFAGIPTTDEDVALVDTIGNFPDLDIQPFRDMIAGQRMDLQQQRYRSFEELSLYCYRVAGTVGLMSNAIVGFDKDAYTAPWWRDRPIQPPVEQAISLGIAKQLTNILRDVGEDARRGRIYLPLEDLEKFGYSEKELFAGVVNDRWRALMQFQIDRARQYYRQAEAGVGKLNPDVRWPVWAALLLYQQILDAIVANDYDVFRRRAYVSNSSKFLGVFAALANAQAR